MTKSIMDFVAEAKAMVPSISPEELKSILGQDKVWGISGPQFRVRWPRSVRLTNPNTSVRVQAKSVLSSNGGHGTLRP